jgi:hypothetical protein
VWPATHPHAEVTAARRGFTYSPLSTARNPGERMARADQPARTQLVQAPAAAHGPGAAAGAALLRASLGPVAAGRMAMVNVVQERSGTDRWELPTGGLAISSRLRP